jgi:hypothetical protein
LLASITTGEEVRCAEVRIGAARRTPVVVKRAKFRLLTKFFFIEWTLAAR